MFKNLNLSTKLLSSFLLAGILPLLIFAYIACNSASDALKDAAILKLKGIKHLKAERIESYFSDTIKLVDTFARTHMIIVRLNEYYKDKSSFKEKLSIYDSKLKHLLKEHNDIMKMGFYDVFIIDKTGNIIYTDTHEADYGTNLVNGKYSDSNLAEGFLKTLTTGEVTFMDFKYYQPSSEPASFIITPLTDVHNNNAIVGAFAVQISLDKINKIMNDSEGLGESGETYLVGSDGLLRSNSRLDSNLTVNNSFENHIAIKTEAIKNALSGKNETKFIKDYRGVEVLSSYEPVKIHDKKWAIVAEIDKSEALAAVYNLKINSLVIFLLSIITIVIAAILITKSITKPINRLVKDINQNSLFVASASNQLKNSSQQLAEGSTEQASSIQEISSTLEETSSMVTQNSRNSQESVNIASCVSHSSNKANREMDDMMKSMGDLKQSSNEIAKIIKVIDEIAFQTNILALNAAVEAARAGDAGQGFAVVAEEVRNLAQKSAQAAKNTAGIIEDNVNISEQGVMISRQVKDSLNEINTQSEKVNALLGEIAEASQEQAQGLLEVNKSISSIDQVIQNNASNAEESASASEELSSQSENMKLVVNNLVAIISGSESKNRTHNKSFSVNVNTHISQKNHQVIKK